MENIERGFLNTGDINDVLSLQLLMICVLFIIFCRQYYMLGDKD